MTLTDFSRPRIFFDHSINEIGRATADRNSNFRWPSLVTLSPEGPQSRTVVIRKFDRHSHYIRLYSDARAGKIADLQKEARCQLLFFNSRSLVQVRASGKAHFLQDSAEKSALWKAIPDKEKRDYLSAKAPGTKITSVNSYDFLDQEDTFFCVIDISIEKYDILKLARPRHVRLEARREEDFEPFFKIP